MSLDNRPQDSEPLTDAAQLVAYFRGGEKPATQLRVGMEHEKIGLMAGTQRPIAYEGPRGIGELLTRLARVGFTPFLEQEKPIAAVQAQLSISLEPGGQLELSGRPFHCCQELALELDRHLALMRALGAELGHVWLGVGYRPFGTVHDAQWMPKGRYREMRAYLSQSGGHGLDMMTMTGTVQANYDYLDEADMIRKLRSATLISPLVTALFANSPLRDGQKTGYLSFRTRVWRDVDPARSGLRPEVLEPGFGYAAYANWALNIPLIFVRRGGEYLAPRGLTFGRFMAEGLDTPGGRLRATASDWEDHLTTLFPEVRLKRVIEVRGADVGSPAMCLALPALWKGLLYHREALEAAAALVPLAFPELLDLQERVARTGLAAEVKGRRVADLCRELCDLAASGLESRGPCSACGRQASDERRYLDPLREVLARGRTPAEEALLKLDGELKGDVNGLIDHWRVA